MLTFILVVYALSAFITGVVTLLMYKESKYKNSDWLDLVVIFFPVANTFLACVAIDQVFQSGYKLIRDYVKRKLVSFGKKSYLEYLKKSEKEMLDEVRKGLIGEVENLNIMDSISRGIKTAQTHCYTQSRLAGWHDSPRETGTLLMLIVSEVAEAMEGDRKGLMDDHLPHRSMLEVGLADACIRIFDLAGLKKLDLAGAITEKLEYNRSRADHKPENRQKEGGKKY